jgi:large subunit ribosomal protein L24
MANKKFHIRKDDTVKVISGNSKGKTGRVLEINTEKETALVEGVNLVTKHTKPSAKSPNGGIQKMEGPVRISKLAVIDPSTGASTRVGRKVNAEGKLQRYSKKTGEFIKNG